MRTDIYIYIVATAIVAAATISPKAAAAPINAAPISAAPIRPAISSAIAGGSAAGELPAAVANELSRQAPYPSAQVVGSRYRSLTSCKADSAELVAPISASGPATLRVSGRNANGARCQAYAFVDVKLTTDALIATRAIREGSPLEGAVRLVRREIVRGESPLTALPEGVVATRSLAPGQLIDAQLFNSPALMPGALVRVQVRTGALLLEETGRIVGCGSIAPEHACATVPSGKRVEGRFADGAIQVESP